MVEKDIEIALEFMYADDLDVLVLQCDSAMDIPYIKRILFRLLGEPSKHIAHSLYYRRPQLNEYPKRYHEIRIVPIGLDITRIYGYRNEQMFYVAREKDADTWWNRYYGAMSWQPYVPVPWVGVSDLYNMLRRDGEPEYVARGYVSLRGDVGLWPSGTTINP